MADWRLTSSEPIQVIIPQQPERVGDDDQGRPLSQSDSQPDAGEA
jgi:hypothetical protein